MSPEQPLFQQQQQQFARYIREPGGPLPAGIEERRMALYAELFFNGLDDHLSGVFPVLRALTDDPRWEAMLRDYLIRHRARSPLFPDLGREFLEYLSNERAPDPADPPYLLELAHYEYSEVAVALSDADLQPDIGIDPHGDLLDTCPVVAPTAWNLTYSYPVHRIGPDTPAPAAQTTHLVIYRDRDDQVRFLEINPVTQRLLILLDQETQSTGRRLLQRIAAELQHPDPAQVVDHGRALLNDLRQRNVILGSRVPADGSPHP